MIAGLNRFRSVLSGLRKSVRFRPLRMQMASGWSRRFKIRRPKFSPLRLSLGGGTKPLMTGVSGAAQSASITRARGLSSGGLGRGGVGSRGRGGRAAIARGSGPRARNGKGKGTRR